MQMVMDLAGQDYENVKVFIMRINPDEDYLDPQTGVYISSDNVKEGI